MLEPFEVMYFSNLKLDISNIVGIEIILDSQLCLSDGLGFDLGLFKNLANLLIHNGPSISS